MTTYLDASAAVKLFLEDEDDVDEVRALVEVSGDVFSSRLTQVETAAALAAARRAGRMTSQGHANAVVDFRTFWEAVQTVELTEQLASDAAEMADTFGLRAADAIQLASARQLGTSSTLLVAWDNRLRTAARGAGIACFPPEV